MYLLRLLSLLLLAPLLLGGWGGGRLRAQEVDMEHLVKGSRIEIPFVLENDFIVVNVELGGKVPLRFIVDTGAENTIVLDREITDRLGIRYRRRFEVRGADVDSVLIAHLATGVDLEIESILLAKQRSLLVLQENYFDFAKVTGTDIHGIIGADFLRRFVLQVDYQRRLLILHEPGRFRPGRQFRQVTATFVRSRPYLFLPIQISGEPPERKKVLLDTGAGLPLLLHTFADSTSELLPERLLPTYIATGLGGKVSGNVGRTRQVELGGRELSDVITYFQEVDSSLTFLNQREGIIGNRILKRFNVVIDYTRSEVYFKAIRRAWKQKFRYDRTGITVVAGGRNLRQFIVQNVVEGSPADRAGVRPGDIIRRVNGTPGLFLSLGGIINRFEGKVGTDLRLRYEREGRLYDTVVTLEDLI